MKKIEKGILLMGIFMILTGMVTMLVVGNINNERTFLQTFDLFENVAFNKYNIEKPEIGNYIQEEKEILQLKEPAYSGSEYYNKVFGKVMLEELDIDVDIADIIIQKGSELQVIISNPAKNFRCELKNNKLELDHEFKNDNKLYWTKWLNNNDNAPYITIIIPKEVSLEKLTIDAEIADIKIDDILAEELDVSVNVGEIYAKGNFTKIDMDSDVGNVELVLEKQDKEYKYDLSAGVGNITIEKEKIGSTDYVGSKYKTDNKNYSGRIAIDCAVGNIIVDSY
jgi:hypothetical protein